MLIDLDNHSPLTIDPSEYPTTLALRLSVGGEAPGFTGVMQGRHDPFLPHERNQPVPLHRNEDDDGIIGPSPYRGIFILDRPPFEGDLHLSYRWYYAAIGFDLGVYVSRTYSNEVTLMCCESQGAWLWSVAVEGERGRFTLILPDYQPGWKLRQ